jgi:hypothetical protein
MNEQKIRSSGEIRGIFIAALFLSRLKRIRHMWMLEMLEFLNWNHNGLTLLFTVVNGCFAWWIYSQTSKLEKYKQQLQIELEKEVGKYKNQLLVECLKAQLKTTQLFNVYPEVFKKLKELEGALARLDVLNKQKKQIPEAESKSAEKYFINFSNYLAYNLLFLSEGVSEKAIKLKDQIGHSIYPSDNSVEFDEIAKGIDLLESQMKQELSNQER